MTATPMTATNTTGSRIRRRDICLVSALTLLLSVCGGEADPQAPPDTTQPPPTTTIEPATTMPSADTTAAPTTAAPTTSAAPDRFTVARHGVGSVESLGSDADLLGSGCVAPSTTLPDGVWLGWIERLLGGSLEFDLACGHRTDTPSISNVNPALRSLEPAPDAIVHLQGGATVAVTEWTGADGPVWIYINGGLLTEIAVPSVDFTIGSSEWTETEVGLPVQGGCCDSPLEGPASPDDPWPTEGLPGDGVYDVEVSVSDDNRELVLMIRRFVPCAQLPDRCAPDATADPVTVDVDDFTAVRVPVDASLTVRIRGFVDAGLDEFPLHQGIEGSGVALAVLLDAMDDAHETWIAPRIAAGVTTEELRIELFAAGVADPDFPYGPVPGTVGEILAYRGPLGVHMVDWDLAFTNPFSDATQLEIIDGRPVLTTLADQIAG